MMTKFLRMMVWMTKISFSGKTGNRRYDMNGGFVNG